MKLGFIIKHQYETAILELAKAMFEDSSVELISDDMNIDLFDYVLSSSVESDFILTKLTSKSIEKEIKTSVSKMFSSLLDETKSQIKFNLKNDVYKLLIEITNQKLPWGILTGIRPVKLVHRMYELNWSRDEMKIELIEIFGLAEDYAELIIQIAKRERKLFQGYEDKASIYISIPFCPTKCVYCSFPTHVYKKWSYLEEEYIDKLCTEIKTIGSKINKTIDTIYIGGGTPSTIKKSNIKKIIDTLNDVFDLSQIREFTYEAGRPDTIDKELLDLLKKNKVTRISINPQTFNDEILKKMGRTHTAEDIKNTINLAKNYEFDINMDLIVGLPDESSESYVETLDTILELNPENITVHALAIKKAANLKFDLARYEFLSGKEIRILIDKSMNRLIENGYNPYYLYRQQHISGNLANVGYSKNDCEGIYNILMMEEIQNIYSFGVGGVSKIFSVDNKRFETIPNFRDIVPYLERFDELVEKKIDALTKS